ncbi:MAG: deoxyribodipyrimidine photo-lyase [Alphaproteobacteria bacterium]|nr:deoxyribodipyrimidine photo-lyase [Alphaproteobacteria bacterium]
MKPVIVWFRQDLRLADNLALSAACASGQPLVCLFILDDDTPGEWASGAASRWWLHHSLKALGESIEAVGGTLVLRRGPAASVLSQVICETGARKIYWNRCYEPYAIERDCALKAALQGRNIEVHSFLGNLLVEPWRLKTREGAPFRVFTPFWKALRQLAIADPLPVPALPRFAPPIASERLESWALVPRAPDWAAAWPSFWDPGEAGARTRLTEFLDESLHAYTQTRDWPGRAGTSRLSAHLHFGEISPRQVWHALRLTDDVSEKFLSELAWREFSHHLLFHHPQLPEAPLDPRFARFAWTRDDAQLALWQHGQTGIPIVDAGMRQLWTTGWMHNRVRMIAASFLVKHMLIDWRVGAKWFWDTLVDADLANNSASWQWIAGCGADAAPYFRIFNPVLQGQRFDPDGRYVRQFVPEISGLPDRFLHSPWQAPAHVLDAANIRLGTTYPHPLVDLTAGRERALRAFDRLKLSRAA